MWQAESRALNRPPAAPPPPGLVAGVVNGIDYNEWSPTVDPHLQSGAQLHSKDYGVQAGGRLQGAA